MTTTISTFLILEAKKFYQLARTRRNWVAKLKAAKEEILAQDASLKLLGNYCTVCEGERREDHSVENCPALHLSYNQRVFGSQRVGDLMIKCQNRAMFQRRGRMERKTHTKLLSMKEIQ
jgi:hypothetical protein